MLTYNYYVALALCANGDIELVGSPVERAGVVRVCVDGTWGYVCDGERDPHFASTVCAQLGFSPHGRNKHANDRA